MKISNYGYTVIGMLLVIVAVFIPLFFGGLESMKIAGAVAISMFIVVVATPMILRGTIYFPIGKAADQNEFKDGKYEIADIDWETCDSSGKELEEENIAILASLWFDGQKGWWGAKRLYRIYNFKDPEGWKILNTAKKGEKIEVKKGKVSRLD